MNELVKDCKKHGLRVPAYRCGRKSAPYLACKECQKDGGKKWSRNNRERVREIARAWYYRNLDKARARRRRHQENGWMAAYHRRHEYGMSPEDFAARCKAQNNACAICGKPSNKLYVDHDHVTGKVRGLLCQKCNTALGWFNDSAELLNSALAYLAWQGRA